MPQRFIYTSLWAKDWFLQLPPNIKLIYLYLRLNNDLSPSGVYYTTLEKVSFDTCIPIPQIKSALDVLEGCQKIRWYPEHSLIWVMTFLPQQSQSPKFLSGVAKSLKELPEGVAQEYVAFYEQIPIPYPYPIDTLSIPSYTITNTILGGGEGNNGHNNVFTEWEKWKKLTKGDIEHLNALIELEGEEEVYNAVVTAGRHGKLSIAYLEGIFKNKSRKENKPDGVLEEW